MATEGRSLLEIAATTAQVLSVVAGVVISVRSFNASQDRDAVARIREADARCLEARKPFLTLRQTLYNEAVTSAAVLVNPEVHTADELLTAKKKFRDLYVAELSMVESPEVATAMVALAKIIDPPLVTFTGPQKLAFDLSKVLGKTYAEDWNWKKKCTD